MDLRLTERVALVAGASRGIGRAIAEALLTEGANVCITGRDRESLQLAATELGTSERVLSVSCDLADDEQAAKVYESCRGRWGGVDILIANVGIGSGALGWDTSDIEWRRLLNMNFETSVRLAQMAVPSMIERGGGSILFVSSITGVEASQAPLPYSAAKAALINYSKNLSRELAPSNIRVNSIAPGNIIFPGGRWQARLGADPGGVMQNIRNEVPMARFGTPEEIADVAVFLCSDRASFVTGSCVVVDGGQTRSV